MNLSGQAALGGRVEHRSCEQALEDAGPPAGYLGLEVTETAIVPDGATGERARAELQELHDLGVRIAIDDFGTGFSSLGQLRRFPIDVIKVDRSFVQGVEHDAKDAAITANLVSLAHALGLVAIAEGIESERPARRRCASSAATSPRASCSRRPVPAGRGQPGTRRRAAARRTSEPDAAAV